VSSWKLNADLVEEKRVLRNELELTPATLVVSGGAARRGAAQGG